MWSESLVDNPSNEIPGHVKSRHKKVCHHRSGAHPPLEVVTQHHYERQFPSHLEVIASLTSMLANPAPALHPTLPLVQLVALALAPYLQDSLE